MNYQRANAILLAVLLLAIPTLLLVPSIRRHTGNLYPKCALHEFTGHPCPMCGLTTGLYALITGDHQRVHANPLTFPVAILFGIELAARLTLSVLRLSPQSRRYAKRWDLRLHGALVLAYLVYCAAFFIGLTPSAG